MSFSFSLECDAYLGGSCLGGSGGDGSGGSSGFTDGIVVFDATSCFITFWFAELSFCKLLSASNTELKLLRSRLAGISGCKINNCK